MSKTSLDKAPIYIGLGDRIKKIQEDCATRLLINPDKENINVLENELQCSDPHLVETFSTDPNGLDAHTSGAKLDAGKPRMGLVLGGFKDALTEVAKVGTAGANKYTDNGWMEVSNGISRYEDALLRHFFADKDIDPDFDLLHKAHTAWNALAVLQLTLNEMNVK